MASKRRTPPKRRKSAKQTKSMQSFNVIAVIVVLALVVGGVGTAVIVELFDREPNEITVDPDAIDSVEQGYRDRIAADPNDVAAIGALANYLDQTGNFQEAIQWYEKALMITPDDSEMRLYFASTLATHGKQLDAELQYKKLLEADPTDSALMLYLARLYRNWSPPRNEDAVTYYEMVLEYAPAESITRTLATEELAELTGTPVASPEASPVASPETTP